MFPTTENFDNYLKGAVDKDLYAKCKETFDTRMNLPNEDENKWFNFEDYLIYYNGEQPLPSIYV